MSDTPLIQYEADGPVALITLSNGKVNAISPQLIDEFNAALDRAEQDNAIVIVTGREGLFSAGYDLKVLQASQESAHALIRGGSTLCRRLLSFPTPVIAACSGHAVAKGAFLLLSADVRIGVSGDFKIGLNEVSIGMTMHHAGIELARARLPHTWFNRSVICGELFDPATAQTAGFLDQVVDAAALMPAARAIASQFAEHMDLNAHHQTKLKARKAYLELLDASIERDAAATLSLPG